MFMDSTADAAEPASTYSSLQPGRKRGRAEMHEGVAEPAVGMATEPSREDGDSHRWVSGRGSAPVDFLIIGAQKAGTMAAVKNLNKCSPQPQL